MKNYVVRFVSGVVLQAESDESLPVAPDGWWRAHLYDAIEVGAHIGNRDLGKYFINMNNVEAIKEVDS